MVGTTNSLPKLRAIQHLAEMPLAFGLQSFPQKSIVKLKSDYSNLDLKAAAGLFDRFLGDLAGCNYKNMRKYCEDTLVRKVETNMRKLVGSRRTFDLRKSDSPPRIEVINSEELIGPFVPWRALNPREDTLSKSFFGEYYLRKPLPIAEATAKVAKLDFDQLFYKYREGMKLTSNESKLLPALHSLLEAEPCYVQTCILAVQSSSCFIVKSPQGEEEDGELSPHVHCMQLECFSYRLKHHILGSFLSFNSWSIADIDHYVQGNPVFRT
jgi:hypothetical protein